MRNEMMKMREKTDYPGSANGLPFAFDFHSRTLSPFTLIELLTVISIIAILASLLQTSLFQSKERAKFIRWTVYSNNMRSDPSLIGQWTFTPEEFLDGGATYDAVSPNKAFGLGVDGYKKEELKAYLVGVEKLKKGRWMGKGATYFPGKKGSFIQINDNGALNPKEDDYTVYVWFKPTTKNTRYIITKGDNQQGGYMIYSNRKLRMKARGTNKRRYNATKSQNLELNKWHLAAMVIDHATNSIKSYLDGQLYSEKTLLRPKEVDKGKTVGFVSDVPFLIGARYGKGGAFRGYIDEVEVFRRALKDSEIRDAYDMGKPSS